MEFIVDNIVWFIVGGVVILMTIVGYLAEKTDFASKKYREKSGQEKEKKVVKTEEPIAEIPDNNVEEIESPIQNVGVADMITKPEEPINVETEADLYAPLGESAVNTSVPEDLYAPLDSNNNQESSDDTIEEDLYAPLSSTDNVSSTIEVNEPVQDNDVFTMPSETLVSNENQDNNLVENTETLEMPVASTIDTLPINDSSDYDKIFPDDPIIINDNNESKDITENVETSITDDSVNNETEANTEDIWKF